MKKILLTLALLVPIILFAQTQGSMPVEETVRDIMAREIIGTKTPRAVEMEKEKEYPNRSNLAQNPFSPNVSSSSLKSKYSPEQITATATLTKGVSFTGMTLSGGGAYPPDNMGGVGPTQYLVAVNSMIVTYNKTTGAADGVLNSSMDNFFLSVTTTGGYTSDPHFRYDRLSKRWIGVIIDVPTSSSTANRILVTVSSDSIITASTTWKYFYYQGSGYFIDYPTLGIDKNAIYIGGNLFGLGSSGSFSGTMGLVVRKSSILSGGPMVSTKFSLGTSSSGIYTPQGVDQLYDTTAAEGYFIGVDAATYGILDLVRVSNPAGTPTISTVTLTVPATYSPGTLYSKSCTYSLDSDDERLYAAMIRDGHLWTAHHISTTNAGVASSSGTRISARWYDITNFKTGSTVSLNQSGTVYSNALTTNKDKNYAYPTITVNGQGHALMGFTQTGYYSYANAGYVYRLGTATNGTMSAPDSNTASSTSYNPTGDGANSSTPHRWGDYTMTEVDPSDNMTFWTIQQYCNASNSYGCRVSQFLAPGPAALNAVTPNVLGTGSNLSLVIQGDTTTGLGFYEPGASFQKHLQVAIDGGVVVNSITYNSPSKITLNVTTTGATDGARTITVTNPDGQVVTSSALLTYSSTLPVELTSFTAAVVKSGEVKLSWSTATEINNNYFDVQRSFGNKDNWVSAGIIKGKGTSVSNTEYFFVDKNNFEHGKYYYRLKQVDNDGSFKIIPEVEVNYAAPSEFALSQNYPNPFNPSTRISFSVAEKSNVKLAVYDILGKEVSVLVNESKDAGSYDIDFNASNLAAGTYFYKLQAGNFMTVKKMSLVK